MTSCFCLRKSITIYQCDISSFPRTTDQQFYFPFCAPGLLQDPAKNKLTENPHKYSVSHIRDESGGREGGEGWVLQVHGRDTVVV